MDSETHFSIVFNIYGGSNQILPNATSATQNYYGDEAELEKDDVSMDKEPALSPEAMRLFSYINKAEDLRIYLVQIAECTNAVELARVIVKMGEREPKITSEEMDLLGLASHFDTSYKSMFYLHLCSYRSRLSVISVRVSITLGQDDRESGYDRR